MPKQEDYQLLQHLAALDGDDIMTITEDKIALLSSSCPTYGGYHCANNEVGINEAIKQYAYNLSHPLETEENDVQDDDPLAPGYSDPWDDEE